MYEYIQGKLTEHTPSFAIIEAQNIGYKIRVPSRILGRLGKIGDEVRLYTLFVVRELSQTLFGFEDAGDRDLFETLISITGIGPKIALSILSHLTKDALSQAIVQNNIILLSKVPGIGKKTAERLVVELKGKLESLKWQAPSGSSVIRDALSALLQLGYSNANAEKAVHAAVEELSDQATLSDIISSALKR